METQMSIFDQPENTAKVVTLRPRVVTPAARLTDPDSSHEAAEQHTKSGKRNANYWIVVLALQQLYAIRGHGITAGELTQYINETEQSHFLDYHEVVRRLSDSKNVDTWVGSKRLCSVRRSNIPVQQWYPMDSKPRAA